MDYQFTLTKAIGICSSCGKKRPLFFVEGMGFYGQFIFSDAAGTSFVYVDSLNDPVFDEIISILKAKGIVPTKSDFCACRDYVYAAVLDPINGKEMCGIPNCFCDHCWNTLTADKEYGEQVVHIAATCAQYSIWQAMTSQEKEAFIQKQLLAYCAGRETTFRSQRR